MAGRGGLRGGGDRVLESRHLVGLFLGVVLLCGVFFTLGYVMGRTQTAPSVLANETNGRNTIEGLAPKPPAPAVSTAPVEPANDGPASVDAKWDFGKDQNVLEPKAVAAAVKSVRVTNGNSKAAAASTAGSIDPKELKRFAPPPIRRGAAVLQLAAMTKEADAFLLADTLRQKNFPSFVVTPTNDSLYRVQVGPYADVPAAEKAKDQLDHAGFKAIVKR